MLALLGRNGAGKTTCMNTVIGWLRPRGGGVRLFGEAIERLSPEAIARKGVGLVPQGRRVFPTLTVRENLEVAFRKCAERFGRLEPQRRVRAFSAAEGARRAARGLALGRRAADARDRPRADGEPALLLMDEPSEGLAPLIVAEVGRTIAKLKAQGQSIVLVEQNVKMALELADDAVLLNTGRVAFSGPAAQVRDNRP